MTTLWEQASDAGILIHQIYYSDETRSLLDPNFVPLDNTANPRPDWYEFWVILNFLRTHELREDAFYGLLSPRFTAKTGFSGGTLVEAIRRHRNDVDVVLPLYGPGQMSFFINVFEQGDYWHPGLMAPARAFFARHNIPVDRLVSHTRNSFYSNYVIARPGYWRRWQVIADDLWTLAEAPGSPLRDMQTTYGPRRAPTKAFIQERIGPALLASYPFRTLQLPAPGPQSVDDILFDQTPDQLAILRELDTLKQRFAATGDLALLRSFFRLRGGTPPPPID